MENEKIWNTFALIQYKLCRVIIPQVTRPSESLTCSHFSFPGSFPLSQRFESHGLLWTRGPHSSCRAWPASASGQWRQLLYLSSTTQDSARWIPVQKSCVGTHRVKIEWLTGVQVSSYIIFKALPLVFRPAFVSLFKELYLSDGRRTGTSVLSVDNSQYKFLLLICGSTLINPKEGDGCRQWGLRQEKNKRGERVPEKVLIQLNSKEKKQLSPSSAALRRCARQSHGIGLGMMLCLEFLWTPTFPLLPSEQFSL